MADVAEQIAAMRRAAQTRRHQAQFDNGLGFGAEKDADALIDATATLKSHERVVQERDAARAELAEAKEDVRKALSNWEHAVKAMQSVAAARDKARLNLLDTTTELAALRERHERAMAALRPFAEVADSYGPAAWDGERTNICLGQCREARDALAGGCGLYNRSGMWEAKP